MRTLIVFEDTFGMTDVYREIHKIKSESRGVIYIDEDLVIFCGATDVGAVAMNKEIKGICSKYSINKVISVFDVDSSYGQKNTTYTKREFRSHVGKSYKFIDKGIARRYMPVIYNAETVILHQYLRSVGKASIINIVHEYDTKSFHLKLLEELIGRDEKKAVKHVSSYLDLSLLRKGLKQVRRDELNFYLCQWILEGMKYDSKYLLNFEEVCEILDKVGENFTRELLNKRRIYRYETDYYFDISSEVFHRPVIKRLQ